MEHTLDGAEVFDCGAREIGRVWDDRFDIFCVKVGTEVDELMVKANMENKAMPPMDEVGRVIGVMPLNFKWESIRRTLDRNGDLAMGQGRQGHNQRDQRGDRPQQESRKRPSPGRGRWRAAILIY